MDQQDAYGIPYGDAPYPYDALSGTQPVMQPGMWQGVPQPGMPQNMPQPGMPQGAPQPGMWQGAPQPGMPPVPQPIPQQPMPGIATRIQQGMPLSVDPHPHVKPKPNKTAMIVSYIISGIGSLVLFVSIFLFVAIMVPQLFGIRPYVITSGSMEPNFPVGCLVYVQDTNPGELEVNDVISFDATASGQAGTVVTHRIVQKDPTDREFITKGDANESNDPTRVSYDAVIGKVVFGVPLVGYIAMATETWDGKIALIAILVGAMILCLVGDRIRRHARRVARKKAVFEQPY